MILLAVRRQLLEGEYIPKIAGYTIDEEDQQGGEDQGSHWYQVFKVTDNETKEVMFVKAATDTYSSYDDMTWDDAEIHEVEFKETLVKTWVKVMI